jgi:phosphate transport system substrate-binding protein
MVVRQDGSGTTYGFTAHLSAISPAWRDRGPGVGTLVSWPGNTMRARGNEGVAGRLKVSDGSIGYVEYHFAKRLGLSMAWLQNKAGRFVAPSESAGQNALARSVKLMPPNLRLFLPDPEGPDAYPIVTFSWLLLYDRYEDRDKGAALKKFVSWGLTEGQAYSRELGYIPLPDELASMSLAALERIR